MSKIQIVSNKKTIKKVIVISEQDQEKIDMLKQRMEIELGESLSEGFVIRQAINNFYKNTGKV